MQDVDYFATIKEYISMNTYMWQSIKTLFTHHSESQSLDSVKQNSLFFLSRFSFTNIYDSRDSRVRGRLSLYILSATSTSFIDISTLAGLLLQRAHLCAKLPAEPEQETFGFLVQVANH